MAASSPSAVPNQVRSSSGIWDRLSPEEFQQLTEYTKYSKTRLKDVLKQFRDGLYPNYNPEEPMDYNGFKLFMSAYVGNDVSEDFCKHLFWTFQKQVPVTSLKSGLSSSLPQTILDSIPIPVVPDSKLSERRDDRNSTGPENSVWVKLTSLDHHSSGSNSRNSSTKKKLSSDNVNMVNSLAPIKTVPMVSIKEIACYLSLLEGGKIEDKLEFVFRVYDSDGNEYLDQQELEDIVQQMMSVAQYLGWDTTELKPILQDMLAELDFDSDGTISLDEWIKGGLTTIPLRVLLGFETEMKDDGSHQWRHKQFNRPAYCNLCHNALAGFGRKQGLQCIFCKYTCHERCVSRAPASCIQTYAKSKRAGKMQMEHHWVEGNSPGKCSKCNKNVKCNSCLTGLHCVWCQITVHNKCATSISLDCNLGQHRVHILPPVSICHSGLKRTNSTSEADRHRSNSVSIDGMPMQITPLSGTRPLAVFVNPKSGGRQGARLLHKFQYLLNPRQVFSLANGGPLPGLKFFANIHEFRVLCCGGDGTVGWVLATLDRLEMKKKPPVAVLPLGTGNDLARCLRWGGGYEGESLTKILTQLQLGSTVMLDRWEITVEPKKDGEAEQEEGDPAPLNIINNYFSIGVDASVALKFHLQREKHPEKFNSRLKNKFRYFECGTSETLSATCKNLHENIEVICDGRKLSLPNLEGIAIVNIPSVYGGANLWGETDKKKSKKKNKSKTSKDVDLAWAVQDTGDRLLEVVGLENTLHVGQVITGVRSHGIRLAQGAEIEIKTNRLFPMQIDGEPWKQPAATIKITHKNQVPMLQGPEPTKRSFFLLKKPQRDDEELESEI